MRIKLTTKNIDNKERAEKLVKDKIAAGLDKLLAPFEEELKTATITVIKKTDWGYEVRFNLALPGGERIFADSRSDKLIKAVTQTREKAEKQIKKYRDKIAPDRKIT